MNTGTVVIKDGKNVLATIKKTSKETKLQMLGQGSAVVSSSSLTVEITVNEAKIDLKSSIGANTITDSKSKKVGHTYNLCIEDSDDDDYNDFYVNVVGWAKKG